MLQLLPEIEAALFAGTDTGITVTDAARRIVYANAAAARIIGFASPEALCAASPGETLARFELFDAEGRPLPPERLVTRTAFEGSATPEVLLRFRTRGLPGERWSLVRAVPVHDRAGRVTHAINFFREVTEQAREDARRRFLLRADHELTASLDYEETLAAVARLATPAIADWCTVDLVDGEALKRVAVAHFDPAKIVFVEDLRAKYPPDPRAASGVRRVVESGQAQIVGPITRDMLREFAVDDDHLRLLEQLQLRSFVAAPLRVRGQTIGVVSFVMAESGREHGPRDVELAQALADRAALAIENARLMRDVQRERASSEESFRLMIESVKDYAIFMLDPRGVVVTWNAGATLIKGYRPDEIIGHHFSRFYTEDAVRAGHCEHELEVATREGRFEEEGWRVRKDGGRFWASVVITAIRGPDGVLRGFAKVTRDLTERKRAEEALRAEVARRLDAEQTSRLAQLFIGVLGHDLRNPLNAIVTGASYLTRIATSERQSRTIARITSSGRRIASMIDQLLDITRFGIGGGIELDRRPVDLAAIGRNVVDELAIAHPDRTVRSEPVGDTTGDWDQVRIEQALSNLVGNALQHGAPATPVSLRVEGGADGVSLVLHNGGAIPADLLPDVFAPFKRAAARSTGASASLGLGLYITSQIIRAHGGTIDVTSSPEAGTTFTLWLPRRAPDATGGDAT